MGQYCTVVRGDLQNFIRGAGGENIYQGTRGLGDCTIITGAGDKLIITETHISQPTASEGNKGVHVLLFHLLAVTQHGEEADEWLHVLLVTELAPGEHRHARLHGTPDVGHAADDGQVAGDGRAAYVP